MQLWIVANEITCQQCHSQKQRFSGQSHYMMCIWNTGKKYILGGGAK